MGAAHNCGMGRGADPSKNKEGSPVEVPGSGKEDPFGAEYRTGGTVQPLSSFDDSGVDGLGKQQDLWVNRGVRKEGRGQAMVTNLLRAPLGKGGKGGE